jgi:tetratricopeptide (TPR) repeat protein
MLQENFSTYKSKEDIFRLLGKCFVKKGMLKAAFKQYLQADRSADTLDLLYELGQIFEDQSDSESAKGCWEEIYAVDVRYKNISEKINKHY